MLILNIRVKYAANIWRSARSSLSSLLFSLSLAAGAGARHCHCHFHSIIHNIE
jgi:hypothetical protein